MAPSRQRSCPVQATVSLVLLASFLDMTHAEQWVVGGTARWNYLPADAAPSFYNDWAANKTFSTGDTLLFEYDSTAHTVLQLPTGSDFLSCNLTASITKWITGHDSVFISKAGTYYYVCGSPSHCTQGMKLSIVATGDYVASPPASTNVTTAPAPTPSHAAPAAAQVYFSRAVTLLLGPMAFAVFV